ncbi:MAG: hypothetical protein ACTHVY_08245 [Brevibacterium yomogidense]
MSRGQIPLIIEDLDVYPQHPRHIGVPTLNSEEPVIPAHPGPAHRLLDTQLEGHVMQLR